MITNKLTVGSNLRWESSRMMLPEHVETILEHNRIIKGRKQPELDEQEVAAFIRLIRDSIISRKVIKISLFDEYEDLQVIGLVERIDEYRKMIKVDGEFIGVEKIIGVVTEH